MSIAYGPVTPKFAQLVARERHLYTFTINPCVRRTWWHGRIPGWYPGFTHLVLHISDRRIIIEPYVPGSIGGIVASGLLMGISALAEFSSAVNASAAANGLEEMKDGLNQMKNGKGEWFAISHTEIACVERPELNSPQRLSARLFGEWFVKVNFKREGLEPLVFQAQSANAGLASFSNHSKEFIEVMGQLL